MKLFKAVLGLFVVFSLFQTSCTRNLQKEYLLNQDVINVFKEKEFRCGEVVGGIVYFKRNNRIIISPYYWERGCNYQLEILSNKIRFIPYKFEKGTKTNYFYNALGTYPPVYPEKEVESLLYKNEYVVAGIKVRKDIYIINITSNDSSPECGIGYFGIYDGKKLERKYLKYEDFPVSLFEVDGSGLNGFSYDEKRNSIFFCGIFLNNDKRKKYWGIHLFRYSLKEDKLYLIKYGEPDRQKKDVFVIPGTDYLMFWDDGVVLKRIVE